MPQNYLNENPHNYHIKDQNLSGPNFKGQKLSGANFKGQNLSGANFSNADIRGANFKGQNLSGANFSNADIRGAYFTNAYLEGADFSGAKAGLQQKQENLLVVVSLVLSLLGGTIATVPSIWVASFFFEKVNNYVSYNIIPGIFAVIILVSTYITINKKGLGASFVAVAVILALTGALPVTLLYLVLDKKQNIQAIGPLIVSIGGAIISIELAFVIVIISAVFALIIKGKNIAILTIICVSPSIIISIIKTAPKPALFQGTIIGILVTLAASYLIYNLAESLLKNKNNSIWDFIIFITSFGGTNFTNSNLTNADFSYATLRSTNFTKANLNRTRFYQVQKLDFARVGNSILAKQDILDLLVSCNGKNKSYIGANLKGANLIGADLREAKLKNTDLTEATFHTANLEGANLTLAQAVGTDFTSARMTGVCVEAWNIESTTKLDDVDCRFIYLLENPNPGVNGRERRPSSGDFQPGEFTKLFEEVLNTVDFIFRNGVDWKAFIQAFQSAQFENKDTKLAIQSIENKNDNLNDNLVVIKLSVDIDANKEKIHSDFIENYQIALKVIEEKYKVKLQAKDSEITLYRRENANLADIIGFLANKSINTQTNSNVIDSNRDSKDIKINTYSEDLNPSKMFVDLNQNSINSEGHITEILIENLEKYLDLTILAGLQDISNIYKELLQKGDYSQLSETADDAYNMCQTIANTLDKEKQKDTYTKIIALASYWKLSRDLYTRFINLK